MQIFIVTQTFPPKRGGMQSVMLSLAQELCLINKTIIMPNHYVPKDLNLDKSFQIYQPFFIKFFKSFYKKIILSFCASEEDIFICDSWKSLNSIPQKFNKNIFVLAHGQEYLEKKKQKCITNYLKRATAIISNSNYTNNLVSKFNRGGAAQYIVPPTYMLPNNIIKQKKAVSEKVVFITIGRLEQRKGFIESMNAFHHIYIKNKKLNFEWNIIGNGTLLKSMKKYIAKYSLDHLIKIYPNINEVDKSKLLMTSDIFIMPSYKVNNSVEGFGIVYAEAARYGIPSIAGKVGGVTDVVMNNINGWNIDPTNYNSLQKLLMKLIRNKKEILPLGHNAHKIYLEKFSKKNSLSKFLEIIKIDEKK